MEKKKKRYLLLGAVLIIWGLIGFQIFQYLTPKEEKLISSKVTDYSPTIKQTKKKGYTISEYIRDPFLGGIYKKKTRKTPVKSKPMVFPTITFNGMVKGDKQKTFIITVNNQQEVLKVGQVFQEVKLVKGNSKEIKIRYKGNYKTISLQ